MKTRELAVCGLMVAVVVILSQVAVPLPISPIPVSLGVLGVYMAAALQRPRAAFLTLTAYLLLGAVGLPVFAEGKGGLGALLGPTGGFLLAYPLMALIVSWAAGKADGKKPLLTGGIYVAAMLLSMAVCYGLGAGWLAVSRELSVTAALSMAVYPFVAADVCKMAVAVVLLPLLRARLRVFLPVRKLV